MKKAVQWAGEPGSCDFCHKPITDEFVDGATNLGPWANMCKPCYARHGVRPLGLGRGQRYVKNEQGAFMKVEG